MKYLTLITRIYPFLKLFLLVLTVSAETALSSSLNLDPDPDLDPDPSYYFDDVITSTMYYQIVSRHSYDMDDTLLNKDKNSSELAEISLDIYMNRFFHTSLMVNTPYVFYYGYGRDIANDIGHEKKILSRLKDIRNESYDTTWTYHDFSSFRLGGTVKDERAVFFQKIEFLYHTFLNFPNFNW